MDYLELRRKYLSFFVQNGHTEIPSSRLVPDNDPSTLFTGSGMQPLIPYLLGASHPAGQRLVDIQKCFRGQDIEEVGNNRHDSFFEMMGNWSLGDYFKKEQLTWYYTFLTKELGLDPKRLHATCFAGDAIIARDSETAAIWESLGIPKERIHFYGVNENWWSRSGPPESMPVGEIGGLDSEVFFEFTIDHDPAYGETCDPHCDCGKFMELGNSVFIQYQKQADGTFKELKQRNVDFGGGLERTLAALNDNPDIFLTSVYQPIIATLEQLSGSKYGEDTKTTRVHRILADHIKAAVFLAADGVEPSNVDRGYILRRLVRRSIRFSRHLAIHGDFLSQAADAVLEIYGPAYAELKSSQANIKDVLSKEALKFQTTLERGLKEFDKLSSKGELSGQEVFYLYESYGFPYELTAEEAQSKGISIAESKEFEREFKLHQERSRTTSAGKFKGGLADSSQETTKLHTAHHLLLAALRQELGEAVVQRGSNITNERLRIDVSYPNKIDPAVLDKAESWVNQAISKDLRVTKEEMPVKQAFESGALGEFGAKYADLVTVYTIKDPKTGQVWSKEICGGPHVEHTALLGKFKILKEESSGSGIRRIKATLA